MISRVAETDTQVVLEGAAQPFTLRVTAGKAAIQAQNTAMIEVTLYQEIGSFVPQSTYLFEAVDAEGQPFALVNADEFKKAVDAYCTGVLATEYYVKSIPRASSLCSAAMRAFNF